MDGSAFRGLDKAFYVFVAIIVVLVASLGIVCGRASMSKYKAEWNPQSRNEAFWSEVLIDKKIVSLTWDETGLKGFVLDSGEVVGVKKNENDVATLFIKD